MEKLVKIDRCINCPYHAEDEFLKTGYKRHLCKKLNRFLTVKDFKNPEYGDSWNSTIPACCSLPENDLLEDCKSLIQEFNSFYNKGDSQLVNQYKYLELQKAFDNTEIILRRF